LAVVGVIAAAMATVLGRTVGTLARLSVAQAQAHEVSVTTAIAEDLATVHVDRQFPWRGIDRQAATGPDDVLAFIGYDGDEPIRLVYTRDGTNLIRLSRSLFADHAPIRRVVLLQHVTGFNVEFYHAKTGHWLQDWDGGSQQEPPQAVSVEMTVEDGSRPKRTITKTFPIAL
jgi:hypothetical protein